MRLTIFEFAILYDFTERRPAKGRSDTCCSSISIGEGGGRGAVVVAGSWRLWWSDISGSRIRRTHRCGSVFPWRSPRDQVLSNVADWVFSFCRMVVDYWLPACLLACLLTFLSMMGGLAYCFSETAEQSFDTAVFVCVFALLYVCR